MTTRSAEHAPILSSATDLSLDLQVEALPAQAPFEELYEIEATIAEIESRDFKCIALQFPDELLKDSVQVYKTLRRRLAAKREIYVLADTTYGSCCVDEIAAEHVNADVIVHYGHSCLSLPQRLPCIMVFTKQLLDPIAIREAFQQFQSSDASINGKKSIYLGYGVSVAWRIDQVQSALQSLTKLPIETRHIDKAAYLGIQASQSRSCQDTGSCCRKSTPLIEEGPTTTEDGGLPEDCLVLFVGKPSLALTNLMMRNPSLTFATCDPAAQVPMFELATIQASRLLMRRYAAIQKAKDADVFGIVVGTLGVSTARYLPLIDRIKSLLRKRQKKVYTLCVGKPTPSKLGNYQEVECFVLVACPENSLLLTSPDQTKEYIRPIISPWELEVALETGKTWEQGWRSEWDTSNDTQDLPPSEMDDEMRFSAATGQLRTVRKFGPKPGDLAEDVEALALETRADTNFQVSRLLGSAAGEHLSRLQYRGLDLQPSKSTPAAMEIGRDGVARGYMGETQS